MRIQASVAVQESFGGVVVGPAMAGATYPLWVLAARKQAGSRGSISLRHLFSGLTMNVLAVTFRTVTQFAVNSSLRRALNPDSGKPIRTIFAAGASGVICTPYNSAMEVYGTVLQQLNKVGLPSASADVSRELMRRFGYSWFLTGAAPTAFREFFFTMALLSGLIERGNAYLSRRFAVSPNCNIAAVLMGGGTACMTHPFDTAARVQQMADHPTGFLQEMCALSRSLSMGEFIRYLFRGVIHRSLRVALIMFVGSSAKKGFQNHIAPSIFEPIEGSSDNGYFPVA